MFKYRYIGDVPVVFAGLSKDGHTWVPEHGDDITTTTPVAHPWLVLIKDEAAEIEALLVTEEPIIEETKQSAIIADTEREVI